MSLPKCPNHQVGLTPTDERRIFICPISDARFECDVDEQTAERKLDKWGRMQTEWKVNDLGEEDDD